MTLLWPILAALLLLLSFAGWGALLAAGNASRGRAMSIVLGIAWACLVGGVLNYLEWVSRGAVLAFVALGLVLEAVVLVRDREGILTAGAALGHALFRYAWLAIPLLVLLALTLSFGALPQQNVHDDNQGYLVFAHRMLDEGQVGDDPFNERRLGVLGGQSFLNAMMLTLVVPKQVVAFDAVLGWLLFLALVASHAVRNGMPAVAVLALLALLHLHQPHTVNISSLVTSLALFYALARMLGDAHRGARLQWAVQAGLLVAALVSLKNSNVVGVAAYLGALLLAGEGNTRARAGRLALACGVGAAALAPWLAAMYRSSRTLLFPLLGRGTHAAPGDGAAPFSLRPEDATLDYFNDVFWTALREPYLAAGLVLVALLGCTRTYRRIGGFPPVVFLLASLGGLALAFAGLGLVRYFYPFVFASFLFMAVEAARTAGFAGETNATRGRVPLGVVCASLALAFYAGALWSAVPRTLYQRAMSLANHDSAALKPHPARSIRRAQAATPSGSALLVVASHPYLLDFERNRFFVVDHAGAAGPDGGLPVRGTAERLAGYLAAREIDYILYSYADHGGFSREEYVRRLRMAGSPYYDRARILAENNFALRDLLESLMTVRRTVYRDDAHIVIDVGGARAAK